MDIILYRIIIQSLNTIWELNKEQLKKLLIYEKCFGLGDFRNESTMEEETNEYGTKTITHTLKREEFFYADTLKPGDLEKLKDISWIFTLEEKRWNASQRRVYNTLNPEYEIETSSVEYICANCKIITKYPDETTTECKFHPTVVNNDGDISYICCGARMSYSKSSMPCKTLDKHCWRKN